MTRAQLIANLQTEKDPIGAVIDYIKTEMPGLVRHDIDAWNNGWDIYNYPEGQVWGIAERALLEAAGVDDLSEIEGIYDDTYDALYEATIALIVGEPDISEDDLDDTIAEEVATEMSEQKAIEALTKAWDAVVDSGDISEIEMAESLTDQVEGGTQGWDMSIEDAEDHPEIAAMIGLDPEADPEDPDEMEDLWEAWGRVVGEAARRWLANHPEAAQAAREEA